MIRKDPKMLLEKIEELRAKQQARHKACLMLLEKIEELRAMPIAELMPGQFREDKDGYTTLLEIKANDPFYGANQIRLSVSLPQESEPLAECIFYRSE